MKAFSFTAILLFLAASVFAQTDSTTGVFDFVEQMPEFPGGNTAMMSFIGKNITYPEYERVNNIEGKVQLKFVVDVDGSVTDVRVVKPVSAGIDSEAIRVVKLLPKFAPGKREGKAVKVYFNLPVRFKLAAPEPTDSSTLKTSSDTGRIYTFVEQNPQFPGGSFALEKFIDDNLQLPKDYKNNGLQPKVLIRFVINEDGSVGDVQIVRSFEPAFDAEAVKVIKKLPNFIPGRQKGKLVKVYFNIPVVFRRI